MIALAKSWLVFGLLLLLTFVVTGYFRGGQTQRKVNLYIWSSYLGPDTLKKFTERTGIQVDYDLYDANETIRTKLQAGNAEYDLVVPSDYMVEVLAKNNLLAPVDRSKLKNIKNVDPSFWGLRHDPEGKWSVPIVPGTTAIGYRKDKFPNGVDSWKELWNPAHKDYIVMLDDSREVFAAALKSLGHSLNTTDPVRLREARDLLIRQKPLLKEYNSSNCQDLLISGEAWIAHAYNGQIAKAAREYPNIGYVIPKEGATRSIDCVCIPKSAPHPDEAHMLIDYLLEPEVAAEICAYTYYTTANAAAKKVLPPEIANSPVVFPSDAALKNCEFIANIPEAMTLLDKYWTEVKAAR